VAKINQSKIDKYESCIDSIVNNTQIDTFESEFEKLVA